MVGFPLSMRRIFTAVVCIHCFSLSLFVTLLDVSRSTWAHMSPLFDISAPNKTAACRQGSTGQTILRGKHVRASICAQKVG